MPKESLNQKNNKNKLFSDEQLMRLSKEEQIKLGIHGLTIDQIRTIFDREANSKIFERP